MPVQDAVQTLKERCTVHLVKPLDVQTELELSTLCDVLAVKGGLITLGVLMKMNEANNELSVKCDTPYGYVLHVKRNQIKWDPVSQDWLLDL